MHDYYEKGNLVLLFIPHDPSPSDQAAIKTIGDHQKRIEAENAHLLALTPQPLDSLIEKQFSEIPVLIDKNSQIRAVYSGLIAPGLIGEGDIIIFILDTYGAPSVCLVGQEPVEPIADEILSWLLYLSIQCPE